jgi:cytochrome c oxidase subunit 2
MRKSTGRSDAAGLLVGLALVIGAAPIRADDDPQTIEVVARRFAFEPDLIEVTLGESVRLVLSSADVTHGFEIDGYDIAMVIPKGGESVRLEFVAERAGRFRIKCSEYCGSGHRRMRGELVVRAREGGAR